MGSYQAGRPGERDALDARFLVVPQQIPTPDFYDYHWNPLASVDSDGPFLVLRWADGTELRAFGWWLRENAVGQGGVDLATREGLLDPVEYRDLYLDARIDDAGALQVRFVSEGVDASYHPGWLRHVAEGLHVPSSWIPEAQSWTVNDLSEPPTHDGSNVFDNADVLGAWVDDMLRFGLARLRNLPIGEHVARQVAERIGPVRDTNFGPDWDVKADVEMAGHADTNSTANTKLRLGPHTDLPTRETPPGFQFLHCIANETSGGESTMADGAAVVEALATEHPAHYEALTTLRWVFFNRGPGIDHRWSGPFIDHGVEGSPLTLRAFYPVRGFPDMDPADMPRAYEAMRVFSEMAASSRFQMRYPFTAGDMIGFDNRRILHGREAFTAGGLRHLRGTYIDQDEVRSFARVEARRRARLS